LAGWSGADAASSSGKKIDFRVGNEFRLYNQPTFLRLFARVFNVLTWATYGNDHGLIALEADDPNPNFGKPTGTMGPPPTAQLGVFYVQ
jgi:hypothetical protein